MPLAQTSFVKNICQTLGKLTNQTCQLTNTIHLTLKMTSAQVVEHYSPTTVLYNTTLTQTITLYKTHVQVARQTRQQHSGIQSK